MRAREDRGSKEGSSGREQRQQGIVHSRRIGACDTYASGVDKGAFDHEGKHWALLLLQNPSGE